MRIFVSRAPARAAAALTFAVLLLVLVPIAAASDSVIATVTVGREPKAVAVNPLTHRVYVANYYDGNVSMIDGTDDSYVATIGPSGAIFPISVVVDSMATSPTAFVGNFWTGSIGVIDEGSATLTKTVPLGLSHGGGPLGMALDMASTPHRLFAGVYGSAQVAVFDAGTMSRLATITVGNLPRSLALYMGAGDAQRLYVLNRYDNTVTVIRGSDYAVIGTVAVGTGAKAVAVDQDTGNAFATAEDSGNVTVIAPDATVLATVDVGLVPRGVAVDASRDRVFVANSGSGTVSVLSTVDFSHVATLTVGTTPQVVGIDEPAGKAFVLDYGSSSVSVVDAALAVTPVTVGSYPWGVVVDAASVPPKAYVTNVGSGTVSVVDEPVGGGAPAMKAAASGISAASVTPAFTAALVTYQAPVSIVIDSVAAGTGGSVVVTGRAIDVRTPLPLRIVRVYWRLAGSATWLDAPIIAGLDTPTATWRVELVPPEGGTAGIEVAAIDAAGAASANADGGGAVAALAGVAPVSVTVTETPPPPPPPPASGVKVGRPHTPSSVRRNRPFAVFGSLSPRHAARTSPVTLYCYRDVGGTWTLEKTVIVRVYNRGRASRYAGYLRLPTRGRWRIVAGHADPGFAPDLSSARTLRVR